ncbi:MAG: preprotein translocase subunit SecA [Dehalococcoidales bacterium]|nr:preprotein translocase subunit SecA [Dehalococcoidales bacterium]MDD5121862.1 preprotein translocase subunit SecA [Dehalococcoidales bacterium]MDD5498442.1 preprotein translocase subunit SecA [Dehalococcoidales bacterium]MDX9803121.1 preprotein translocase subunit SecA [Dehalococcoidales bacterium]
MFKLFGFGDSNEKIIKKLQPLVDTINQLEESFVVLSDDELKNKTAELKNRLGDGETLDSLLPEAFAAVREASKRTLGLRHYDVQLIGGIVLHQGKIAEMKTGEGKTLVATLPLYLNAISGKGAHLVTVNDYLARRDAYWMGPVYHRLGLKVGSIYPMQTPDEMQPARIYDPDYDSEKENDPWRHFKPVTRREAYLADITYGTSAEFGFDYLRDNMVMHLEQCVQRELNYAVIDEVDSLLIDEARTPLIISAPDAESPKKYQVFARLVQRLQPELHYEAKEKERVVELTDDGYAEMEKMLEREGLLEDASLYDPSSADLMRHLRNALQAREFYKRDKEYMVKDGEVIIVDPFTGRLMLGRRYSEGLHQAIEAKEGVKVKEESRTFATITIQNYFRMYEKLSGMTGTAATEDEEFARIYKLDVVVIPPNKPMVREDLGDRIYKDEETKFKALITDIKEIHATGQPLLIGTASIEKSDFVSELLKRKGVKHNVLNARQHEREAEIIARAGEPGAVTVATNMAGRGVDILLGGKKPEDGDEKAIKEWEARQKKVLELGGLYVIGTERHEARRIDNQLRGRAGRQGDPGKSRFYVSLDDDLMRRFGSERIKAIMDWAGMDESDPIENKMVSRSIADAQKRVEGYHFDVRKQLVDFDDVVNRQREIIYAERRKVLAGANLKTNILGMIGDEIKDIIESHTANTYDPDYDGLLGETATIMPVPPDLNPESAAQMKPEQIQDMLIKQAENLYQKREQEFGDEKMRLLEKFLMLKTIDSLWVEHLTNMEFMRLQAGWQTLQQTRAADAYKNQGFAQFQVLLQTIRHDVSHAVFRMSIVRKDERHLAPPSGLRMSQPGLSSPARSVVTPTGVPSSAPAPAISGKKVGRNEPCPCGSGKKYKHCCGR